MATTEASFSRPVLVGRIVYGTITLMSVLIIYDGWQSLRLRDIVVVIVGPVWPCSLPTSSRRHSPSKSPWEGK